MLFLYNAIPILPMDGGRMVRCTLARFMPPMKATKIAFIIGMIAGPIAIVSFLYFGMYWAGGILAFMMYVSYREYENTKIYHKAKQRGIFVGPYGYQR